MSEEKIKQMRDAILMYNECARMLLGKKKSSTRTLEKCLKAGEESLKIKTVK